MTGYYQMTEIDRGYLGQVLLERGFRDWFLYMFRVIENTPFITEPVHERIFAQIQDVIDGKASRLNLNMCPRTGKTTIAKWFAIYGITLNPRAQTIYTSFSQDLLSEIASQMAAILMHPIYQAMYGNRAPALADVELDPIDEFWKDWLYQNTNREKFSSRKITTAHGGIILLSSIGSAITGFGCGQRNARVFSGALIIDDANKPADIRSQTMRERVHTYFVDTLFTRLNNSDTPILNIQQRLHVEDLTGYLESVYGFHTIKFPLLDEDGKCALPRQYTPARILELQKNSATFAAQYQQTPVKDGGNLIKSEWFKRYTVPPARFDSLYIVADTAFTEKKSADNSAFGLFGLVGKDLYMLDGYCKKVIFPDLCRDLTSFYQSATSKYPTSTLQAIYIENKGSGISLIQQLREKGLPISELQPVVHNEQARRDQVADKYTRFMEIAADLESGYFHIPESAPWLLEFISQCEAFTGGKQDAHDDFCDVLTYSLKLRRKGTMTDWSSLASAFKRR